MNKIIFILISFVFLVIFVLFLAYYSIYLIYGNQHILVEKNIIVPKGASLVDIANLLENEGVIKNKFYFIFYVLISGEKNNLKAGDYQFKKGFLNIPQVVNILVSPKIKSKLEEVKIVIPEGYTIKDIENKLRANGINVFLSFKKIKDYKKYFDFLADAPDDLSLEGYLFPDTYIFLKNDNEDRVIKKFLNNFNKKLSLQLKKEISKQNKTIFDIIVMASLIEKEVRSYKDRQIVSGILWKRLKNNIPLQVDATINYITRKRSTKISLDELKIDSSYNTYLYKGLPKGPISNPGLSAIKAAIYPKKTSYWFYLTTKDGRVIYSKNFDQHKKAKKLYLN